MKNFSMKINRDEFISSYNFARLSDVVYSEVLTEDQYSRISPQNHTVISRGKNIVFYKLNSFELKENDIVFCNLSLINELFFHLNKVENFKNIKLITNQTDSPITKKIYYKKPKCVATWYSINNNYEDPNLVSIPLGLSNEYSPKNPDASDFINLIKTKKQNKELLMYMNFQENTNIKERKNIYRMFKDKEWVVTSSPNLSISKYVEDLNKYAFVICPWGNGFETHRFWETLYAGSIPVLKYHQTYASSEHLPVLYVDRYEDINLELLTSFYNDLKFEKYDYSKLKMNYWKNLINKENILTNSSSIKIYESKFFNFRYLTKNRFKTQLNSKTKKILFFLRQIKKVPKKLLSLIKK